jgi:hypothetical protein
VIRDGIAFNAVSLNVDDGARPRSEPSSPSACRSQMTTIRYPREANVA